MAHLESTVNIIAFATMEAPVITSLGNVTALLASVVTTVSLSAQRDGTARTAISAACVGSTLAILPQESASVLQGILVIIARMCVTMVITARAVASRASALQMQPVIRQLDTVSVQWAGLEPSAQKRRMAMHNK